MFDCSRDNSTSGIYAIVCSETGLRYVGRSNGIGIRVMAHVYLLRNGTHDNKKFQSDFTRLGEDKFTYIVLEKLHNPTKDMFLEREEFHISLFPFSELYNARRSSNVGASTGEITEETRLKQSLRQVGNKNHFHGKKHSEETLEKMRISRAALPKFKCSYCSFEGLVSSIALHVKKHN